MSGQQRDVLKWQLIVNKCFLWILLLDLCQVRRPQQATLQTVATDGFLPASHFGDACREEHVTWPMPSSNGPNGSWFGFGELTSKSVHHKLYKEVGFKLSNKLTLQEYLVKVWPFSYRISNPLTHVRSRRWSWSHEVVVRCQTPHNVLWQADGSLKVGERMKGSLKVGWAFVAFQGQEICTSKNIYNIFCINDKGSSGLGKKMVSRVSFCWRYEIFGCYKQYVSTLRYVFFVTSMSDVGIWCWGIWPGEDCARPKRSIKVAMFSTRQTLIIQLRPKKGSIHQPNPALGMGLAPSILF